MNDVARGSHRVSPAAGPARDVDRRLARWCLAGILLVGFVLRVVYVLQARSNPYFDAPQMDALYHMEWARALAHGREFQPGPFFRAPLYPWFLALVFKIFGDGLLAPRIVQAGLGTLSIGLVYLIGQRAFDRRVGLLAAAFASIYWVSIYFDGELQLPTLEVPAYLAAIWLSMRLEDRRGKTSAVLAGFAWGVAALVRPNVLLFAPLVALWIVWRRRQHLRTALLHVALFSLGLAAPIAPITIYNQTKGGDRVLISSQAGVNLWIGNNPQSDGSAAIVPGTRADWWGGYDDSIQQAELAEGRPLKPSEVSRYYTKKALRFVLDSPQHALMLTLWKLRLFWIESELGNNADERFFAYRFGSVLRILPLGFAAVAPLGIVGLFLARRRATANFPLWGFVPVYTVSVVAFFVCSRYRVPVVPVLIVYAAYTCVLALDTWRVGPRMRLAWISLGVAAGVAFVRSIPSAVDQTDAKGLWQLGVFEAQHGNSTAAVDLFQASIAQNPRFVNAHHDLGLAFNALGMRDRARESFERALELAPASAPALRGLVYVELEAGRPDEARVAALRMVRMLPTYPEAHYLLARAECARADALERSHGPPEQVQERLEDGLRSFRRGLELHPNAEFAFNCAVGAGTVLTALRRPAEAAEAFGAAVSVRSEPDAEGWFWTAWQGYLQNLKDSGRVAQARERLRELEPRFPDSPHIAALKALLDAPAPSASPR